MHDRELTERVTRRLQRFPAVAVLGPRQIGKTTLAREIAQNLPSTYLDLENPQDFLKLSNPKQYLALHADRLVILDEVQCYPDLFMSLRGVIDARRREGRGDGRLLILGSASGQLLKQNSESLAGRIYVSELTGLNPLEIEQPEGNSLRRLWVRGGFPESYSASDDQSSLKWRQDLILTYFERYIPQIGPRIPASILVQFSTMLAHVQGQSLNASALARSLGVANVTVSRYLDMMVELMLVSRLEPWYGNSKKRRVKSPRIYIRDSGILHALLQIPDYESLLGHPILGKSWEGLVIENIVSELPFGVDPHFYRTSAGAEIDLLLQFGLSDYWAIAIRASRVPIISKGFHMACEDLKVKRKFVVYGGEEKFPIGNETTVLSLSDFILTLRKETR